MSRNVNAHVLEDMREYMEQAGYSAQTIKARILVLRRFSKPFDQVTARDVLAVLPVTLSPSSRRTYVGNLRAAFRDLMLLGACSSNPVDGVRVGRTGRSHPRPLTPSQVDVLLSQPGCDAYSWSVLGLYAGFRASDVVGVYPEDLEESHDGWVIHVDGKGNVRVPLPAHPLVVDVVKAQGDRGPFWRMRPDEMSTRWAAWVRSLGLPTLRFHQCRHTFATRLYAATGDLLLVRDAMRHTSVATTQIYAQMDASKTSRAVAAL